MLSCSNYTIIFLTSSKLHVKLFYLIFNIFLFLFQDFIYNQFSFAGDSEKKIWKKSLKSQLEVLEKKNSNLKQLSAHNKQAANDARVKDKWKTAFLKMKGTFELIITETTSH